MHRDFSGEVSNVNASAPDDTEKEFQLSYDYTKKSYGDWTNYRIVAPIPWFGIEGAASQEKKPKEPIFFGALGEVDYESHTTLPSGYAPKYASKLNLSEDFADYQAVYSIENGILTANRKLVIKKSRVPLESWETYKKFCKTLADERDRFIDLITGATVYPPGEGPSERATQARTSEDKGDALLAGLSTKLSPAARKSLTEAAQRNPEAARLMREAALAMRRHDVNSAYELLRKVAAVDSKFIAVHAGLGWVYLMKGEFGHSVEELRKELEYHPELPAIYQTLAYSLLRMHRTEEAIDAYRKWMELESSNPDAALRLSKILSETGRNAEAVDVLEKAVRESPNRIGLQTALASAYLRNKQVEQGLALIKRAAGGDRDGLSFNDIAYTLADMKVELALASEYGQKALALVEAESLRADDDNLGLGTTQKLGAIWDTVGWIYFRLGEYQKAVPYLHASWALLQRPVVGDHLGQVYAKLGNKQEALHIYKLALASTNSDPKEELRQHYEELLGRNADVANKSSRRGGGHRWETFPEEELSRMRTFKITSSPQQQGSSVFTIVFSEGKVEAVRFVSGFEALKAMASQIASAKFHVALPDSHPVRLFRRGILACGKLSGCDLALLLPDGVNIINSQPSTNNAKKN